MTGKEAIDLIMSRLGNRSEASLRTIVLSEMRILQQNLEGEAFKPWFLWKEAQEVTLLSGAGSVALPTDFLRFDDELGGLYYVNPALTNDRRVEIKRDTWVFLKAYYQDSEAGPPEKFDIVGDNLAIRPYADMDYTISVDGYFAEAEVLDTANFTNDWLTKAADLLVSGTTGIVAAQHTRDMDVVSGANGLYAVALKRLHTEHVARMVTMTSLTMGDD